MMSNVLTSMTKIICEELNKENMLTIADLTRLVNEQMKQDNARRIYDVIGILEALRFIRRTPRGIAKIHQITIDDAQLQALRGTVNAKEGVLRSKVRKLLQLQKLLARNAQSPEAARRINIPLVIISTEKNTDGTVKQNFVGTEVKMKVAKTPQFFSEADVLNHAGITANQAEIDLWIAKTERILQSSSVPCSIP